MRRSLVRVGVALSTVVLVAAGCNGGDDGDESSSTTTSAGQTTTTGATPASNPSNNPTTDAAIEQLQRELNSLGCNAGPIDGELGPDTIAGIKHFQTAAGIGVDGIVGPQTRAELQQASATGNPNCRSTPAPPTTTTSTTTTSGGGNQPNCNEQLINAAVTASLLPGEQVVLSGPFECSGNWATVAPTVRSGQSPEVTITVLLRWNGSAWQSVDRSIYCENGEVPQPIYPQACESN